MRIEALLEDTDLKKLALLVQSAFIEDLDWDMELDYKDGFFIGELKMSNGQAHGDAFVFFGAQTVLVIADPSLLKSHSVSDIISKYPDSSTFVHVNNTRQGAAKFVKDYYT